LPVPAARDRPSIQATPVNKFLRAKGVVTTKKT